MADIRLQDEFTFELPAAVSSAKRCAAKRHEDVFLPHIFLPGMPFLRKRPVEAVVSADS